MGTKAKVNEDHFKNEFLDEANVLVEIKVSNDDGDTWQRRKISMVSGMDESCLLAGEMFQFNDEKFKVLVGDDGLIAQSLKIPTEKKSKQGRK